MSLQQDVLDTIGPEGIEKDRLREKVGNISQNELDQVIVGHQKAGRVRLVFGRYELVPDRIKQQTSGPTSTHPDPPPTAEEEAAASLGPVMRQCERCLIPKELNAENFSRNRHGFLKICKGCYAIACAAGREGKVIPVSIPQTTRISATVVQRSVTAGVASLNVPPNATPGATLTGEGSQPPAGEPSRPRELHPTIADRVIEAVRKQLTDAGTLIEAKRRDIATHRQTIERLEREIVDVEVRTIKPREFLELYERFAQEAAG